MIKTLGNGLFSNDNIIFVTEGSNYVTWVSAEMGILSVDLNNINLDGVNFDEDDVKLLFMSDLWLDAIDLDKKI